MPWRIYRSVSKYRWSAISASKSRRPSRLRVFPHSRRNVIVADVPLDTTKRKYQDSFGMSICKSRSRSNRLLTRAARFRATIAREWSPSEREIHTATDDSGRFHNEQFVGIATHRQLALSKKITKVRDNFEASWHSQHRRKRLANAHVESGQDVRRLRRKEVARNDGIAVHPAVCSS